MATPIECTTCERPMRSCHAKAVDFPGTIAHAVGGLCATCYAKSKRAPRTKTRHVSMTSIPDFTPEQTARVHSLSAVFGHDVKEQAEFAAMLLGAVRS